MLSAHSRQIAKTSYHLQRKKKFNSQNVFGASKMMNLLFTFELARRLENTGVTVNAVAPGVDAFKLDE